MFSGHNKTAAHEIPKLRESPLGTVVTHKVRIINGVSFDLQNREKKGDPNAGTNPDAVSPCLWAEAMPTFLTELVSSCQTYAKARLLMSTADVPDAFPNVRIAQNIPQLLLHDFRLILGVVGITRVLRRDFASYRTHTR